MRLRTVLRTGALSLALCLGSAGTASAFNYGTLEVRHNGSLEGKGYGSLARINYNQARLKSVLADMRRDGTRTFSSAKGSNGKQTFSVQSGRRSDGQSTFAAMADRYGTSSGAMIGFRGYVKICQDVSNAPDWCSGEVSANL
jgi:hypothetical protein